MILVLFGAQALVRELSQVALALTPWLFALSLVSGFGLWITRKPKKDWSKEPFLPDYEDWTEEEFQEWMEEFSKM